jgi:hypothetical protein
MQGLQDKVAFQNPLMGDKIIPVPAPSLLTLT